jgi:hypothetical protein
MRRLSTGRSIRACTLCGRQIAGNVGRARHHASGQRRHQPRCATASRVLWGRVFVRGNAGPCPFRVIRFAKSVVAVPRCWLLRSWSMLARHGDGDVMTVLTTHNDRPERSDGAKRNGAARVLVIAGALAAHLSCVRSYIAKLVDQGILERRSDDRFDQDQCRAKYSLT